MKYTVEINGDDVTKYAIYPLALQNVLDYALDQGFLVLRGMSQSKPFKPFSKVKITISAGEGVSETLTMLVGSDKVVTNTKTEISSHEILLVEETKELERVICSAKSFSKPLVKEYVYEE